MSLKVIIANRLNVTGSFNLYHRKDKNDEDVKIVAVDLQAMAPLPGVIQIQGDITKVKLGVCDNGKTYILISDKHFI